MNNVNFRKIKFSTLAKGMLMGICDLIPGISGGTIALLTGIYAKLIDNINYFTLALKSLFTRNKGEENSFKSAIQRIDFNFLATLAIGITIAIFSGSWIITYLLQEYKPLTLAFFIGLILASTKIIYHTIDTHNLPNKLIGLIGLLFGISLAFITPVNVTPSHLYIFFAGFFAISAMILPGISGAFILLIMGVYEFVISILHNLQEHISFFTAFVFGLFLGIITIAKIVSYIFNKDKSKTLYFLLGLVIGALSVPTRAIIVSQSLTQLQILMQIIPTFLIATFLVLFLDTLTKKRTNQS